MCFSSILVKLHATADPEPQAWRLHGLGIFGSGSNVLHLSHVSAWTCLNCPSSSEAHRFQGGFGFLVALFRVHRYPYTAPSRINPDTQSSVFHDFRICRLPSTGPHQLNGRGSNTMCVWPYLKYLQIACCSLDLTPGIVSSWKSLNKKVAEDPLNIQESNIDKHRPARRGPPRTAHRGDGCRFFAKLLPRQCSKGGLCLRCAAHGSCRTGTQMDSYTHTYNII